VPVYLPRVLDRRPQTQLLRFLLSPEAQQYFSGANYEIPTVVGVSPAEGVPAIDSVVVPAFDLNKLTDLQGTVDMLIRVGAVKHCETRCPVKPGVR
jgi:iron(III) transport system substrate-binding protein